MKWQSYSNSGRGVGVNGDGRGCGGGASRGDGGHVTGDGEEFSSEHTWQFLSSSSSTCHLLIGYSPNAQSRIFRTVIFKTIYW